MDMLYTSTFLPFLTKTIEFFLNNQTKLTMLLEGVIITLIVVIVIILKHRESHITSLRDTNPVEYYQNVAPLQNKLTNLWTIALCEETLTSDGKVQFKIQYLEEVFTSKDDATKLTALLNADLNTSDKSKKYWTLIQYESPVKFDGDK